MKDSFYLTHDLHARDDRKWTKLILAHGYKAYGIGWAVIERIYEEDGRLPDDELILFHELRMNPEKDSLTDLRAVLESDLFYRRDGFIGSESADRRISRRDALSLARSVAGSKGGSARQASAKQLLESTQAKSSKEGRKEGGKEGHDAAPSFQPKSVDSGDNFGDNFSGGYAMPWGEHKGKPIKSIPPGYCLWVLNESEKGPDLPPLLRSLLEERSVQSDAPPAVKPKRCKNGCSITAAIGQEFCPACIAEGRCS